MKKLFRFMDWPLRGKMAALLIVVSLLPLALAAFIDVREARHRLLASTADLLAARADQLLVEIDTFNRGFQRSVERVADLPIVRESCQTHPGDPASRSSVRAVLEVWPASDASIRGVAILDLLGTVSVATEDQLVGMNLSYHGHVRAALRGAPVISDVHLAEPEVGYAPTISYLAPVLGSDRKLVGIAVFWVHAASLWASMKASNALAGPASFAVMFDNQGIRIAHTYDEDLIFHPSGQLDAGSIDAIVAEGRFGKETRQLLQEVRAFPEQFDRSLSESPDLGMFRGLASVSRTWAYGVARRFQTVPWTVFYMIPEASLETQIAVMTRSKAIFASGIILLALIAGTLFAAVILKPVRSLSEATESLARGDLTARVRQGRGDELGLLTRSFNSMAERLEAQAAALLKARGELDLRVQERTAELGQTTKDLETEIAERKRTETELRASEAKLQTIVENLTEGLAVSDLNAQLLHFNRAALEMHGFGNPEEGRRRLTEFQDTFELAELDGTIMPIDQWPLARILRGENVRDLEVRIRRIHSNWQRVFNYGGTLVHDSDGQPLMAAVTINDITERKRVEEEIRQLNTDLEHRVVKRTAELEAANKELEAFSYSVSHDLRAPLRAVDGFSQAVVEDYGAHLPEEGRRYLHTIRESAQRMGELIDDLLTFSRLSRKPLNTRPVDTGKLVRNVLEDLSGQLVGRQIDVRVQDLPACHGDPALLMQVWVNLISNALKFTRKRDAAVVEIGSALEQGENAFFVRDNGSGFDMKYADKLFGVFQRLHRAEEFDGTGVGLAIVQRIIHRHGGRVWADAAEGHGATFYFTVEGETNHE